MLGSHVVAVRAVGKHVAFIGCSLQPKVCWKQKTLFPARVENGLLSWPSTSHVVTGHITPGLFSPRLILFVSHFPVLVGLTRGRLAFLLDRCIRMPAAVPHMLHFRIGGCSPALPHRPFRLAGWLNPACIDRGIASSRQAPLLGFLIRGGGWGHEPKSRPQTRDFTCRSSHLCTSLSCYLMPEIDPSLMNSTLLSSYFPLFYFFLSCRLGCGSQGEPSPACSCSCWAPGRAGCFQGACRCRPGNPHPRGPCRPLSHDGYDWPKDLSLAFISLTSSSHFISFCVMPTPLMTSTAFKASWSATFV